MLSTDIIKYLKTNIPKKYSIEIFDEMPKDDSVVRYGIYVGNMVNGEREIYKLGLSFGGSIYNVNSSVTIKYVSVQRDANAISVQQIIENITHQYALLDGYHATTYTHSLNLGDRSETHDYTFNFKKLDIV